MTEAVHPILLPPSVTGTMYIPIPSSKLQLYINSMVKQTHQFFPFPFLFEFVHHKKQSVLLGTQVPCLGNLQSYLINSTIAGTYTSLQQ